MSGPSSSHVSCLGKMTFICLTPPYMAGSFHLPVHSRAFSTAIMFPLSSASPRKGCQCSVLFSLLHFLRRSRNARGNCVGTHITTSSLCVPTSVDQGSVPAALFVATKPVSKQPPKSPAPLVQDQQASCPPPASGSRHVAPSGNTLSPKRRTHPLPLAPSSLAALLTANRVIFLWYQRTNKTFENSEKPSRRRCWKNPQELIAEDSLPRAQES